MAPPKVVGNPGSASFLIAGHLLASPVEGSLYKAELGMLPLATADEFAEVIAFEHPLAAPVVLTATQRCDLLRMLVVELTKHLPELTLFVVRMAGPEDIQLPSELLAQNVLLVHSPSAMGIWLAALGKQNFALVDHGLLADVVDRGCNELEIRLMRMEGDCSPRVEAFVRGSTVLAKLANLRFEVTASRSP